MKLPSNPGAELKRAKSQWDQCLEHFRCVRAAALQVARGPNSDELPVEFPEDEDKLGACMVTFCGMKVRFAFTLVFDDALPGRIDVGIESGDKIVPLDTIRFDLLGNTDARDHEGQVVSLTNSSSCRQIVLASILNGLQQEQEPKSFWDR